MEHKDYIESKVWHNFKSKYNKSSYKQNCFSCESKFDLILHHITYERLWKEKLEDVVCLCNKCHNKFHKEYPSLINNELKENTYKFIEKERTIRNLPELVNKKKSLSKLDRMEVSFYKNNKEARNKEREIQKELSSFKYF